MTTYIIKSCVSLLLLFGLYRFLLRREKLFVFNRFFLLFAVIFSLIIPFISIPVHLKNSDTQRSIISVLNNNLPANIPEKISDSYTISKTPSEVLSSRIEISQILLLIYFSGVVLLFIRFLRNIFIISRQTESAEKIRYSGYRLALTDNQINPFCFFNTMFVNKDDFMNKRIAKELLYHEIEHIKQSHSIDVVFIELIQIIYWFNPIIMLYNRAIRVNHEFLADNYVIRNSSDIKSYSNELINFVGFKRNIPLTTGFNHSLTRKRLIMLTKSKPKKINAGIKILMTITLTLMMMALLSFKNTNAEVLKPISISKAFEKNEQAADSVITQPLKPVFSSEIVDRHIPEQDGKKRTEKLKSDQAAPADGVVAVTNMNVLYVGIFNPIEIAVPGVTSDKVSATTTNGIINKTATGWEINPATFNDLALTILVDNKKVSEKTFRVKPIPAPVAVFAGKSTGSISKNEASITGTLEAEMKDFLWDLKYEIVSFTFSYSKDGYDIEITTKGNNLTDEMNSALSDLTKGKFAIFKDIKAIGPDGKLRDLNPIILKVD